MLMRRPTFLPRIALLLVLLSSCGGEELDARVVVGLTTDMAVGFDVRRLEATVQTNGAVALTESLVYGYGEGKLSLPAEMMIPPAEDGAEIELSFEAFQDGEAPPVVTRRAVTRASGGRTLLLPISLDEACSLIPCTGGATCSLGACVDPFISPSALASYDPAWLASAPDACKTPSSGDPAIEVGQGASAFAPLNDNEVTPIEAGPQGGHHVWLALRVTGLRQMGSRVTVEGYYPDLAFELLPFSSQVTLRKAGEGHCEIYGIRFQIDREISVAAVKGQILDMEIALEDPNGDKATAAKRIVIAP